MATDPGPFEIDHKAALAALSLIAGALSCLLLLASLQPTPSTPAEQLAFVMANRGRHIAFAAIALTWTVFSVPLIAALETLLANRDRTLARAAALLSTGGILLLGFAIFAHIGAMLSIAAASDPPNAGDALYQVAIWTSLRYYLTDPGLMTWGLGQFLFGCLAWKSPALPNWLAITGLVGGLAGLLTLAVYQTPALALVQLAAFALWGLAAGVVLIRGRSVDAR